MAGSFLFVGWGFGYVASNPRQSEQRADMVRVYLAYAGVCGWWMALEIWEVGLRYYRLDVVLHLNYEQFLTAHTSTRPADGGSCACTQGFLMA